MSCAENLPLPICRKVHLMLLQVLELLSQLLSELLATVCKAENYPHKLFSQRHAIAAFVNLVITSHRMWLLFFCPDKLLRMIPLKEVTRKCW